jgi:hypothetical protein
MTTQPELAALIEKGYSFPNVKEERFVFIYCYQEECRCCPLGAALIAKVGNAEEAFRQHEAVCFSVIFLADALDISPELRKSISRQHFDEVYTVKEIIELLKLGRFPLT